MKKSFLKCTSTRFTLLTLCFILGHSVAFATTEVRTEKFHNGVVSSEMHYDNNFLVEQKHFDIDGNFTSWYRYTRSGKDKTIVAKLCIEKESYGAVMTQEEWLNLNERNLETEDSRLVRKWHHRREAPFELEYIGLHELKKPYREIQKNYLDKQGQPTSQVYLYYKGQDERPYAFIERAADGRILREFSLYEKYDLEGTLRKAGHSEQEVAVLKNMRQSPDKFLVAIIDSGFDYNHTELVSKWWNNPLDPVDGVDNDGNGWIDDNFGWDQVRNIGLPTESTSPLHNDHRPLSHGTHVAHIATRGLDQVGLIGFAGDYTRADYIRRMSEFIKKHKVKIVNMSLGFPADNKDMLGLRDGIRAYRAMIEDNPDTLFVVASGNAGVDLDQSRNKQYPASFTHPNVMKVGALDAANYDNVNAETAQMADFSNFGESNVDILTPGVKVVAASLGGGLIAHTGTSMASPYMVNLAIRLWSEAPELTAVEVRELFVSTAKKMKNAPSVRAKGYADLKAALQAAKMKKLKNRKAALEGPNCWNSATYLAGLSQGVHHTYASEFANLLGSELCKSVPLEQAEAGDIIALRRINRNGRLLPAAFASEVHGYTLISTGLGFTKNGVSAKAPYEEQPMDQIFNKYRSSNHRDCKQFGIESRDCKLTEMAYRCETLESHMDRRGGLTPLEREALRLLKAVEKNEEQRMLEGQTGSLNKVPVLEKVAAIVETLKSQGRPAVVTDYLESRIESLEFR